MEKKRKTEDIVIYLLHERAFQMKEYFRNQRRLFTSLRSKILYLQKSSKSKSLQNVFNVRGAEKLEKKSP